MDARMQRRPSLTSSMSYIILILRVNKDGDKVKFVLDGIRGGRKGIEPICWIAQYPPIFHIHRTFVLVRMLLLPASTDAVLFCPGCRLVIVLPTKNLSAEELLEHFKAWNPERTSGGERY